MCATSFLISTKMGKCWMLPSIWIEIHLEGYSLRIMANLPDCDIRVSEFELLSHYYIKFRTNTIEKDMNLLIPPAIV